MRYRFKGIVRTTGQTVEGHAHGDTPDDALQSLSDHGIVTESLREDPEPLNMSATAQPFSSAIDSALDTAASQVPFDKIADRYKGKNVWVLDRDKIRTRVAQVVDSAIREATNGMTMSGGLDVSDLRKQVSEAIGGLFKDNRNLTSQVSDTSMKMEHQIRRLEQMVHRQESLLAQMTIAISRMGSGGGGGGGGWGGPRRMAGKGGGGGGGEQNSVLMEIFKENLRLRGIEIDEIPKPAGDGAAQPQQSPAQQPDSESNTNVAETQASAPLPDRSGYSSDAGAADAGDRGESRNGGGGYLNDGGGHHADNDGTGSHAADGDGGASASADANGDTGPRADAGAAAAGDDDDDDQRRNTN